MSDKGFSGVVIELGREFKSIVVEDNHIRAGAGARISSIIREAYDMSLKGFSFAVGIPGTVGGALVTNAGTKAGEISDLVKGIIFMRDDYNLKFLSKEEIKFDYRRSNLKDKGIVVEADFILELGNKRDIKWEMERYFKIRKETQPLNFPTAGCVFKNPSEKTSAGYLIDRSGCKGLACGGAMVSDLHANYIINIGRATASDIFNLIDLVKRKVYEEFNKTLAGSFPFH